MTSSAAQLRFCFISLSLRDIGGTDYSCNDFSVTLQWSKGTGKPCELRAVVDEFKEQGINLIKANKQYLFKVALQSFCSNIIKRYENKYY
jgi:predicted AAA+ superfamily ATPase